MGAEQSAHMEEINRYLRTSSGAKDGAPSGTSTVSPDNGQELRDTIQFLAIQNMHMYNEKKETEKILSQVRLEKSNRSDAVSIATEKEIGIVLKLRNYAVKHNVQILVSGKPVGIDTLLELEAQNKIIDNNQTHGSTQMEHASKESSEKVDVTKLSSNLIDKECVEASSSTQDPLLATSQLLSESSSEEHVSLEQVDAVECQATTNGGRHRRELELFKEDLKNKREERHKAISARSSELEKLRRELQQERSAKEFLEQQLASRQDSSDSSDINNRNELLIQEIERLKHELSTVDATKVDILTESKSNKDEIERLTNLLKEESLKNEQEREFAKRRIDALKDVAALSKQMLTIRESQVTDLKERLRIIKETPNDNSTMESLKTEIERQLQEISNLKAEHENHQQEVDGEKESLAKKLEEISAKSSDYERKYTDLKTENEQLRITVTESEEMKRSLQTRLDLSEDESKGLSKEISLINSVFTQMLVGNSSSALDLDKLTRLLQENHDLITEMTTKEDSSETAASLPKLLLDLVNQIDSGESAPSTSDLNETSTDKDVMDVERGVNNDGKVLTVGTSHEEDGGNTILAVEEIASNLPKVWRVLMELLSHHIAPTPTDNSKSSCYKRIDTPSGPKLVPSVSNTYIRLKDLILEKKSLQRDLGKLKQLNGHLESKLHEQETRLSLVSAELQKTWGVVGRLRSQFRQLRTHEQILRYELQQKRNLLTELKTELEYCREKWERARQKDLETAEECQKLRNEFAARKLQDRNNSSESGFSEGKETESGDDEKAVAKHLVDQPSVEEKPAQSGNKGSLNACDNENSTPASENEEEPFALNTSPTASTSNVSQQRLASHPCTKIIWMSLLKLHLMFSAQNRTIHYEQNHSDDMKSLESIFSLQPIVIPESILKQLQDQKNISNEMGSSVTIEEKVKESRGLQNEDPSDRSNEPCPSTSGTSSVADGKTRDALGRTPEEALAARAARLQRLEEQTQMLFKKVTRTTNRSAALCTRLEELHEQYGVPNPPPLPQVLPALRIPVSENPVQNSSVPSTVSSPALTNESSTNENDNEDEK